MIRKTGLNNGIRYLGNKTSILSEIKKLLNEKKLLNKNLVLSFLFQEYPVLN